MARKDKDKPNLTASSEPKNNIIRINKYRTDEDAPDLCDEMTDQPDDKLNVPDYLMAGTQGDDSCQGQQAAGSRIPVLTTDMPCEAESGGQRSASFFDQPTVIAPGGDLDAICADMTPDQGVGEMTAPKTDDARDDQASAAPHFTAGTDDVPKAAPRYDNQMVFAPGGDLNVLEPKMTSGGSDKGPFRRFVDSAPAPPSILASGNDTDPFFPKDEDSANSSLSDPRSSAVSANSLPASDRESEEHLRATSEKADADQDNQETVSDIAAEAGEEQECLSEAELFAEKTLPLTPSYPGCASKSVPGSGDKSEEDRRATSGQADTDRNDQATIFDLDAETAISPKGSPAPGEEFSDENTQTLSPSHALPEKRPDKTPEDEISFIDLGTQNIVSPPHDEATEEFDIENDDGIRGGDLLSADDGEDASAINLGAEAIVVPSAGEKAAPVSGSVSAQDIPDEAEENSVDLDASTIMASQESRPPAAPAETDADAELAADLKEEADEDEPVFELGTEAIVPVPSDEADTDASTIIAPRNETLLLTPGEGDDDSHAPDTEAVDLDASTIMASQEIKAPTAPSLSEPEKVDEDESVFELGAEAVIDAPAVEADADASTIIVPRDETLLLTPEEQADVVHAPDADAADVDASTIMASQEIKAPAVPAESEADKADDLPDQSDEDEPVFELGAEAIVPALADEDESVFELGAEAVIAAPADDANTDIPPEETLLLTPEKEPDGSHAPETDVADLDASTISASQEIRPPAVPAETDADAELAADLSERAYEDEPALDLGAKAAIDAPGDEADAPPQETLLLTPDEEADLVHAVDLDASTIMASQEIRAPAVPAETDADAELAADLKEEADEDEPVFELGAEAIIEAPADENEPLLELGADTIVPASAIPDNGPTDAGHDTIDLDDTIFQESEETEALDLVAVAEPLSAEGAEILDTDEDLASREKSIIEPDTKTIFSPVCHLPEAPCTDEETTPCEVCEPDDARPLIAPIGITDTAQGDEISEPPDVTDIPEALYADEASDDVYEPDMLTKSAPEPKADLADAAILSEAEISEEIRHEDVPETDADKELATADVAGGTDAQDAYDDELTSFDLLKSLSDLPAYDDEGDYSDTDESIGLLDVLQAVAQKDDQEDGVLGGMLDVGMISKISPEAFEDVEERMPEEGKVEDAGDIPPAEAPPAGTMAADETGLPESERDAEPVSAETSATDVRKAEIVKKIPPAERAEKYYLPISPDEAAAVLENAVEKVFSEKIERIVRQVTEQAIIEGLKRNNPFSIGYLDDDPV